MCAHQLSVLFDCETYASQAKNKEGGGRQAKNKEVGGGECKGGVTDIHRLKIKYYSK